MFYYKDNDTKGRISVDCIDWGKIKTEYIAGGTSYRKLAKKYDVPKTTLERRAKNENWLGLRGQAEDKAETKIVDAISKKQAKTSEKIIDVADKLLDKIDSIIGTINDTQGLKHITSALKDIKDIKGFKSEADIREQEARIAKLQKDAQAEEKDAEIKVVMESDLEEYSI
jgi:hypothetical protein